MKNYKIGDEYEIYDGLKKVATTARLLNLNKYYTLVLDDKTWEEKRIDNKFIIRPIQSNKKYSIISYLIRKTSRTQSIIKKINPKSLIVERKRDGKILRISI